MDYYYDIEVNFQQENINYFEWLPSDNIQVLKRVPIFYISREQFLKVYSNKITIESELYSNVENKTLIGNKHMTCMLFCDKSNTMVINFDKNGVEKSRSSLNYTDDEIICEMVYTLKKRKLTFNSIGPMPFFKTNRCLCFLKEKLISIINSAYHNLDYNQIEYYYLELFNQPSKPFEKEYQEVIDYIKSIENMEDLMPCLALNIV